MDMQLRADFAMMDQGTADIASHAGTIDDYRAQLKSDAAKVLGNFGGGMGSEIHQAAMSKVDQLVDEFVQGLQQQKTGLSGATQTFMGAGTRMEGILGQG